MKTLTKIILLIAVVSFIGATAVSVYVWKFSSYQPIVKNKIPTVPLLDIFYVRGTFLNAQAKAEKVVPERGVRAIVVPHHLLASQLISDAFARASGEKYKTVVVVGPNHDNRGVDVVTSSAVIYETPNGWVYPDEEKINDLRKIFSCQSDYNDFLPEHSVGAMVSTVSAVFPDAKIVPIILSSRVGPNETNLLSDWLAGLPKDTLVVFSVDFSHYLTEEMAEIKDKETYTAIMSRDIKRIEKWGNNHIDSPNTVVTMIKMANKLGSKIEIVDTKNANDFLSLKVPSTTSYFEIIVK